jgi:hypothetical protein
MKERLTNEKYWNEVWAKSKNTKVAQDEIFEQDLMKNISMIDKKEKKSIIEI